MIRFLERFLRAVLWVMIVVAALFLAGMVASSWPSRPRRFNSDELEARTLPTRRSALVAPHATAESSEFPLRFARFKAL
jgi:hypothetical protein